MEIVKTDKVEKKEESGKKGNIPDGVTNAAKAWLPGAIKKGLCETGKNCFSQLKPQAWLIRDFLPDVPLGFLVGDSGIGKSFFTMQLAMSLACGESILLGQAINPVECFKVTYFNCEDSKEELQRRYCNILATYFDTDVCGLTTDKGQRTLVESQAYENICRNFKYVSLASEMCYIMTDNGYDVKLTPEAEYFEKMVSACRDGIIFLDTQAAICGVDENNNVKTSKFGHYLISLAEKYNVRFLLVSHTGKPKAPLKRESCFQRVYNRLQSSTQRGASALYATARWQLAMTALSRREGYVLTDTELEQCATKFAAMRISKANSCVNMGILYFKKTREGVFIPIGMNDEKKRKEREILAKGESILCEEEVSNEKDKTANKEAQAALIQLIMEGVLTFLKKTKRRVALLTLMKSDRVGYKFIQGFVAQQDFVSEVRVKPALVKAAVVGLMAEKKIKGTLEDLQLA